MDICHILYAIKGQLLFTHDSYFSPSSLQGSWLNRCVHRQHTVLSWLRRALQLWLVVTGWLTVTALFSPIRLMTILSCSRSTWKLRQCCECPLHHVSVRWSVLFTVTHTVPGWLAPPGVWLTLPCGLIRCMQCQPVHWWGQCQEADEGATGWGES